MCAAIDDNGEPCTGIPMMRVRQNKVSDWSLYLLFNAQITSKEGSRTAMRKNYFIACSGWRRDFKTGHRTSTIPDSVDERLLAELFSGKSLPGSQATPVVCSSIVSAHIGAKFSKCRK